MEEALIPEAVTDEPCTTFGGKNDFKNRMYILQLALIYCTKLN